MTPTERLRSNDALLLVDVQNDFFPGGALPVERGDEILTPINRWIRAARERGLPVYASRDWHPRRHISFRAQGGPWPEHCLQDSAGAAFHPELELPDDVVIISKGVRFDHDQYSAFDDTGFSHQLQRDGAERLWVGGLAQDVCVRATVIDACEAGFDVVLLQDATFPVSREKGDRAMREMRDAGAEVERS